jgi:polyhydroxybutyrate depolymerase
MKNYFTLVISLFFLVQTAFSQSNTTVNINVNGVNRSYRIYVPAIYSSATAVPLVFNFHGYTSTNVQQEAYGNFRPIADTANFIVVHPQGLVINGSTGWNNFGTVAANQGDLNFVEQMITEISAQYSIDQNRIYSTGMSNGGFMSYDLACFMSARFAAIASVTGGMMPSHKNACQASHPTPVMQIHGTADAVVTYNGNGIGNLHVDSLVKFWVKFNNCNPTPTYTAVPNSVTTDNCTAEHYVYSGGTKGSTVEFFKIIGGGHNWAGAPISVNGNTNMDINASKEIWRFFSKYKLNELLLKTENINDKTNFRVYPNPSKNQLTIELENSINTTFNLYDASGRLIQENDLVSGNNEISTSQLTQGVYMYTLSQNQTIIQTGKIVKEN